MKKTYVTHVPNRIGVFLEASRCFAQFGVNITRVSYNKAIDEHTVFLDAEGSEEDLNKAAARLAEIGYLLKDDPDTHIVLAEFHLKDEPGTVTGLLELIQSFNFNISYVSTRSTGTGWQWFRIGILVTDNDVLEEFMNRAKKLCEARLVDYNPTEKNYDNSVFYTSFAAGLAETIGADEATARTLMVNANLVMQNLDERNLSPYRTFDTISRSAEILAANRGEAFEPRISKHRVSEQVEITLIEPPCGSNIAILRGGDDTLFIDCGLSCMVGETLPYLREYAPGFDDMHKRILITHADLDHCGGLELFDEAIMTRRSAESLRAEWEGRKGFRERNPLHAPFIRISKTLTGYKPVDPAKVVIGWEKQISDTDPIEPIGFYEFSDLRFEVCEGRGGHLPGELMLIDYEHRIVFTGDVFVNLKDMIVEQKDYNRCAPVLMTSVDTDPALCAAERAAIFDRLTPGKWQIFGAHGAMKEYIKE